ncbi:LuxR family transcriptional regulator [Streptomyces cinnamoneus]|nr:LuxR family transcriptional regulator [Streptomyces cinnamoneus]
MRYLRGASPVGAADGQADDVRQALAAGAEVRVAGLLLERLVVCDRTIAFLPAHDEDCGPCLEVRHPALVRHLALAFDTAWRAARPVAAADGAPERPRDELRHAVLRMMVEGHTDEVIARRLGVSPRTVAAHVRREAVSLGSRSRAQLGYLLARSGMRLSP